MFDLGAIKNNVYCVRKWELNLTQEEFAEMIDTSKDTVSNIERGLVIPSTPTLAKLAETTNKTVDFFLMNQEEQKIY